MPSSGRTDPSSLPREIDERVAALQRYQILDTPTEQAFDDITRLIAEICQTPIAVINFIDRERQWFKSEIGLGVRQTPLDISLCAHALQNQDVMVVPDTLQDPRFVDNPLVTGPPRLRFYAGAPLRTPDQHVLGTLCVLDQRPRQLSEGQINALRILARHVMTQLEIRRSLAVQGQLSAQIEHQARIFNAALTATSDFAYILGPDGRFIYANSALLNRLGGLTIDQIIGKSLYDLNYPQPLADKLVQQIQQVVATKQKLTDQTFYLLLDGHQRYYEYVLLPVLDANGEVDFIAGSTRDITDRHSTDQMLLAGEARFRFLSELSELTRDLTDPEQVMAAITRKVGQHLGAKRCAYAEVEEDGDHFTIRHDYTDGAPSTVGRYQLSLFGQRAVNVLRSNRTLIVNDVDAELAPDDGADTFNSIGIKGVVCCSLVKRGRLSALMAVHSGTPRQWSPEEVSLLELVVERSWSSIERARIARDLLESNQRLSLAQAAGRVGVFDWLIPEDRVIWSPELEGLYGVPTGTFEGSFDAWRQRVVPEDAARVQATLAEVVARQQIHCSYEFRAILPDGNIRWLIGQAQYTYNADGKPIRLIGVNVDNTEQKRIAEDRERLLESERIARSEAERASRMKDEFLATLSHELRTPLNAILGWSQILRQAPGNEEDLKRGLETIARNARAQTQIIEDLLDMSRIISGKVRLDVQRMDLAPVVDAALDTIRPAAEAKGVRLIAVLDPVAAPVSGDPNRLQQVLWNLLSNAVKFTPRGGRVQVLLERVNSHLEISVIDTGEGIKPDFLPHVFDRFRQADASITRRHGGLGLGLAIVKQLVELHGGNIRVKSAGEGGGSTFIVSLPLIAVHPPTDPEERGHPKYRLTRSVADDACVNIQGLRVLVVDDEPDARALVRRLLEDCHAHVVTADDANEAIHCLQTQPFDVLVSDIGMPVEDGYSLIRRVRALGADGGGGVPALALTAYARSEDRVRSVIAGFQMHIAKPVEPAELITMVASLARQKG